MSTSILEWPIVSGDHVAYVRAVTTPEGGWDVCLVHDGSIIAHARYVDWHRVEQFRARAGTLVPGARDESSRQSHTRRVSQRHSTSRSCRAG